MTVFLTYKARYQARTEPWSPKQLITRFDEMSKHNKESFREALLEPCLGHQAVRSIRVVNRTQMHVCILLADHSGVNPNKLLQLAGWPTLNAFDIHTESAENLSPETVNIAKEIARILNSGIIKNAEESILTLVNKYSEEWLVSRWFLSKPISSHCIAFVNLSLTELCQWGYNSVVG